MYKLLIVEDDVAYRYAVRSLLGRAGDRYEFLPDAINGKHALEIMQKERPDVIITDISMPEMNGVELIKRVKASRPEIKILALSAYDDFAFVKEALKSGAEDYLLKYELEESDLGGMLDALCTKIDKERKERRDSLEEDFRRLVLGEPGGAEKAGGVLRGLFPGKDPDLYAAAAIRPLAADVPAGRVREALERLAEENARCRFIDLPERKLFAAVLNLSSLDANAAKEGLGALAKRIVNRVEQIAGPVCVSLSEVFAGTEDPSKSFRQAERLLERGFYLTSSRILHAEEGPTTGEVRLDDCRAKAADLLRSLEAGDGENAEKAATEFFGLLGEKRPDLEALGELAVGLFADFFLLAKKKKRDFARIAGLDRCPLRLEEIASSFAELERTVSACALRFLETEKDPRESCRREIAAVRDYLRRNFRKDVELADIAASLGYSPNYLCNLFKKETGLRIFEYLNKVRIEEAVKLLSATNLKVYEIAERTGFRTASYFSQTFKDVTGRSISEYRKSLG